MQSFNKGTLVILVLLKALDCRVVFLGECWHWSASEETVTKKRGSLDRAQQSNGSNTPGRF